MSTLAKVRTPRWTRVFARPINTPLYIGVALMIALITCALAAPWLAPHNPNEAVMIFNGTATQRAPYPVGTPGMPLGSDLFRRDTLSRLLYGTRYTLLFGVVSALLRVAIGVTLGTVAGWYARAGRAINVVMTAWSAIPGVFFALLPLTFINKNPNPVANSIGFLVVVGLTGWAEMAVSCRSAVGALQRATFVESAYAIGVTRAAVLWRHVLPNIRDLVLVEAAYATGGALLLVAELGFFGVFVGGASVDQIGNSVSFDPVYAEWGAMLARGVRERSQGAALLLIPLAAFVAAILAFNLVAEGLRKRR